MQQKSVCIVYIKCSSWTAHQGHSNTKLMEVCHVFFFLFVITLLFYLSIKQFSSLASVARSQIFFCQASRPVSQSCFCWNLFSPGWVAWNILTLASLIWIGLFMFSPQQRESYKRSLFVRIACVSYQVSQAQAFFQTAHKDPVWPMKNCAPYLQPKLIRLHALH